MTDATVKWDAVLRMLNNTSREFYNDEDRQDVSSWAALGTVCAKFSIEPTAGSVQETTKPCRYPATYMKCINYQVKLGWLTPMTKKQIADPEQVLLICNNFLLQKPNGNPRQIHNGRCATAMFQQTPFFLPNASEPLKRSFNWLGKLDLSSAYMHLPMAERMKKYSCLRGPDGKVYRWNRLVWGISPSPEIM
jgi:hypothetical protein